jgi:hypothetical protein
MGIEEIAALNLEIKTGRYHSARHIKSTRFRRVSIPKLIYCKMNCIAQGG